MCIRDRVPDEETGGGRQNTMKILDKREEAWEEKKKSDGWNGYHVPVSYTHLDVYKRQSQPDAVEMREARHNTFVFRKTSQENSFLDELRAVFAMAKEDAPSILLLRCV